MHQNCSECTRLWSEYALAMRHYLKLEGRLRFAGDSHDRRAVAELTPMMERATAERLDLRRQIHEHESTPFADAMSA